MKFVLAALVLAQTINVAPDGKGGFSVGVSGWRQALCQMFCPGALVPAQLTDGQLAQLCIGGQPPGIRERAVYGYVGWKEPSREEARRIFEVATHRPSGWPGHQIGYVIPPRCDGAELPTNYVWLTDQEAGWQVDPSTGCAPWPRVP